MIDVKVVLDKFEKEMLNEDRELEIAEALEFPLFNKNENYVYGLQFDKYEKTFSVVADIFEENGGDWIGQKYLKTYSIENYGREFLVEELKKLFCVDEIVY